MLKRIGRLLILLVVLFSPHHWVPSAHAQGGLVFRPYWTFMTETPVTHVQTGDIDGDGLPEVVILTAGGRRRDTSRGKARDCTAW
jgi:hypothetical protein